MAKRLAVSGLVLALLLGGWGFALADSSTPWIGVPVAAPGTAQLYELTESMKLVLKGKPRRTATSALMGVAAKGTPLCPEGLVAQLAAEQLVDSSKYTQCTVNATGSDNISLATGLGSVSGQFTVVAQGDNNVDSPELVVMKGTFRGKMNFAPAIVGDGAGHKMPYGTVTGQLQSDAGGKYEYAGVFKLPFLLGVVVDGNGVVMDKTTNQPATCDPTVAPAAGTMCMQVTPRPVYLDLKTGQLVEVAPNEYALGYPTVKFEISFP